MRLCVARGDDMQVILFDPRLGNEETAERKLLYFHPPSTAREEQVRSVGFCEAVTNFLSTFTSDTVESVHTQQGRQVFFQPESYLWLALIMPHRAAPRSSVSAASSLTSHTASGKSNVQHTAAECEQLPAAEEATQDGALRALLQRVYGTVRMACGPLQAIAEQRGLEELRALLNQVMPLVLKLELAGADDDVTRPDLLDTLGGMKFLPVDRRLYLRIQYMVNLVLTRHSCVEHAIVLHGDHLVWSSLTKGDCRSEALRARDASHASSSAAFAFARSASRPFSS